MSKKIVCLVILLSALTALPAQAQTPFETWTISGPTTLDANSGYIMQIDETGYPPFEIFFFLETDYLRTYASRELPGPWENFPAGTYAARHTTMSIGQSWNSIPTDSDQPTTATVRAFESITVPAGTFNAYKVEGGLTSNTAILDYVYWFVDGVGIVQQEYYNPDFPGNPFDDRLVLTSYSVVGGSGYFPLADGNTWSFDQAVSTDMNSFGSVKALFD